MPLAALQAWLLARGWELACADALPPVAGEATMGSLLAAWGGSLLGPRVHALTVVDHAGQARLVSMFTEFAPSPPPARPRAAQVESSQHTSTRTWALGGAMFCMAFGRAGEPSGRTCTSCPPSMYSIAVVSRKLAAAQQPAVSPYCMWLLAMQVVRLSREADERALERFVHAHGLLGVVVDAALACRPACLMRTRVRCVSAKPNLNLSPQL